MGRRETFEKQLRLGWELVLYEVRKQYQGPALGLAWAVLEPAFLIATYFILFFVIFKVGRGGRTAMETLVLMMAGLLPFRFFAMTVGRGTTILNSHAALIKQIKFPIGVLPFVTVAQVSVETTVGLMLLLPFSWYVGWGTFANLLLIPAMLLFALFLVGFSYVAGCYSIMLPDLKKLLPMLVRPLLFLSPVLYLPSRLSEDLQVILMINPISYYISTFRYSIMADAEASILGSGGDFLVCAAITAAMLLLAHLHRDYLRNRVVDYL